MSDAAENSRFQAPEGRLSVAALVLRAGLGCWFVYSGGFKVFVSGLDRFTQDIANYKLVPAPWDAVAAYAVPWFEIVAGLCLMLGVLRKGALTIIAGLVCVFVFCIAWAWYHQLDISCGCHGGEERIQYWAKAAEFAFYYICLAWLGWIEFRSGHGAWPLLRTSDDEQ